MKITYLGHIFLVGVQFNENTLINFNGITKMAICSFKNCNKEVEDNHKRLHSKIYCNQHYFKLLGDELKSAFQNWNEQDEVPEKFRYFLGRCSDEEDWETIGGSFLTKARIRDRANNFIKNDNGCEFDIIRHYNAWEGRGPLKEVIEHWKADIKKKTLELIK